MAEAEGNFKLKVLIVEDDAIDATFFENIVKAAGCTPVWAGSVEQGAQILNQGGIDLVLSDLVMEGLGGMDLLRLVKRYHRDVEVIIITAFASVDGAVDAMKSGAFSYFVKGDPSEKLVADIKNVARRAAERTVRYESMLSPMDIVCLDTSNRRFQILLRQAQTVSTGGWSVVLSGRSGSGRRTLGRFIHLNGPQPEKRYFVLNRAEAVELAHCCKESPMSGESAAMIKELGGAGTVHILDADFIPEKDLAVFPHLMHQVGGGIEGFSLARVKFIFSTSPSSACRVLEILSSEGLSPMTLTVPSLHERAEDIPVMARRFAAAALGRNEREIILSADLVRRLAGLVYAENLVSLKGLVENMVALMEGDSLSVSELEAAGFSGYALENSTPLMPGDPKSLRDAREDCETRHIRMVLGRTNGNRSRTAEALGITPRQLYNKIVRYGLD